MAFGSFLVFQRESYDDTGYKDAESGQLLSLSRSYIFPDAFLTVMVLQLICLLSASISGRRLVRLQRIYPVKTKPAKARTGNQSPYSMAEAFTDLNEQ